MSFTVVITTGVILGNNISEGRMNHLSNPGSRTFTVVVLLRKALHPPCTHAGVVKLCKWVSGSLMQKRFACLIQVENQNRN